MSDPIRYEKALIGTALAFPTQAGSVSDVRPQDMSVRSHQVLWTIVLEQEHGNRLSYQGVIEKLHAMGEIDTIGADVEGGDLTGELYLEDMLSRRAEASIRDFADEVIGGAVKRELRILGQLMALDAEGEEEVNSLLDSVEEKIYALRRKNVDTGIDIGTLLGNFETRMDEWRAGNIVPAFTFSTPGLKKLIPFLEDTDFMLIAGRPGEGKSSLLRFEMFKAARSGRKVAIFNLENGDAEYARYMVGYLTGIDTWLLRQPHLLTPEQVELARNAVRTLKTLPLRIVSMGSPTVYEVVRVARKLVSEGFEVFGLDYIQLVKNGIENEVQDITMTSSILRGFSIKYEKPFLAAAQLNRGIVHRTAGSEPELADLRGSGSLEQDAVIVAFNSLIEADDALLRNFPQNIEPDGSVVARAVPMRVFVKKNRNGPIGKTNPFLWDKSNNRFVALSAEGGGPWSPGGRQ